MEQDRARAEVDDPAIEIPEGDVRPAGERQVLVAVLAATLLLGSGVGWVVVGPSMGGRPAGDEVATAQVDERIGDLATLFSVENLVVNPAGSMGTRFLILTVALRADDESTVRTLAAAEAEVRDALQTVLASKTVEQLSDVSARDALKIELQRAVAGLLREGRVERVYLPQFVLQ